MSDWKPLLASARRESVRRLKSTLALAWIRTHPKAARQLRVERSWLVGGFVGKAYGDNGAALHQYLRRSHPEITVYWVIDRDSPDVEVARRHGPVLFRDDVMTYVRAFLAEVIAVSHGVHDVPGCASSLSASALKVRLGHGLTALKRTRARRGQTVRSANAVFDLVPVCSDFERRHKLNWGIPPERLVVAGMPRLDTLMAKNEACRSDSRRILYMPTWRDGVSRISELEHSPFFGGFEGLVFKPSLHRLLERYGATLDVYLHPNLRPHLTDLHARLRGTPVRHVELRDPQRLFAESGMLITDYSSVAWDMLYLDKPVLFYQPDLPAHERGRGAHIPLDGDLPGPVGYAPEQLITQIEGYLTGALESDPAYRRRKERWQRVAFAFRDDRNSERVTEAILQRLRSREAVTVRDSVPGAA